jgi:hypothetical protein
MKKNIFTFSLILLVCFLCDKSFSQTIFRTTSKQLKVRVNGESETSDWTVSPDISPDICFADCELPINTVTFSDGKDSVSFGIALNQTIDFVVLLNKIDTAHTRIRGVLPNLIITDDYIKKYNNRVSIEIPEVSELVNVLMALHPDAEKEGNMFQTDLPYYRRMKKYFSKVLTHPALDTIKKYIGGLHRLEDSNIDIFSEDSYKYYYALKMNACSYSFDANGKIVLTGALREMAQGWNAFDPMKDLGVFEQFAKASGFREFYRNNTSYYDSLITLYNTLNPIEKMKAWLDKTFQTSYGSYVVYFSPLVFGAHSTQKIVKKDFSQTCMFICPSSLSANQSLKMNELQNSRVVFTEIDHNYVNPMTEKCLDKVNVAFSHREKWARGEVTQAYNNSFMVFNEYMTFAMFSLYVNDHFSWKETMEFLPTMEKQMIEKRGYVRFKEFNRALLEKYRKQAGISINDLYAYILEWSKAENEK